MPVGLHSSIQVYIYIHTYNIHHEPICWPSQNATYIPMVWGRHFATFTCYCIKLYIYIHLINSSPFLCHHYIPNRSSKFLFRSKLCFWVFPHWLGRHETTMFAPKEAPLRMVCTKIESYRMVCWKSHPLVRCFCCRKKPPVQRFPSSICLITEGYRTLPMLVAQIP